VKLLASVNTSCIIHTGIIEGENQPKKKAKAHPMSAFVLTVSYFCSLWSGLRNFILFFVLDCTKGWSGLQITLGSELWTYYI